jgi:hypothetical protein
MWPGIYIKDVGAGPASIAEPFRTLLDPDLVVDPKAYALSQTRPASWAGGMPTWLRQPSGRTQYPVDDEARGTTHVEGRAFLSDLV